MEEGVRAAVVLAAGNGWEVDFDRWGVVVLWRPVLGPLVLHSVARERGSGVCSTSIMLYRTKVRG